MVIEKLTCGEDTLSWSATGGEFLDFKGTGSIGAVYSVTDDDSLD